MAGVTKGSVGLRVEKEHELEWPVRLFNRSVLKQRKLKELVGMLGVTRHLDCLDIGSDNGVISYFLRQRGGNWTSADLDEHSVRAIERLVQTNVFQIDGRQTPFHTNQFDRVVIVDFLEHIPADAGFVKETYRILKPGGQLIINVPHARPSLLRRFRHLIGQTDEKHGHLRPGYTLESLHGLLGKDFTVQAWTTYSKFFSELIDTLIVFAISQVQRSKKEQSKKGLLVTGEDLSQNRSIFKLYSLIYPVVWLFSQLDRLLFFTSGYMLIVKAQVNKQPALLAPTGNGKETYLDWHSIVSTMVIREDSVESSDKKRILVTGGTGFTGSHLVRRLIAEGHDVVVLDNQKGIVHDELENLGAEIHIGSVTDRRLVDNLVQGSEVVQHLAAAFRKINLPKEVYWDVNVNGTRYLLEAAEQYGVRKFVYTSTCGVHGNVKNPPANEMAPIEPADYYQFTKYEGEKVAREFMDRGLDITILRPAAIYGPEDPERWIMLFKQVATGTFPMFGDGKATYHPLYIDNLTDALMLAMEHPAAAGQTYLIADEHYYSIRELVDVIAEILDKDVKVINLPFWPLWTAAVAVEAVSYPFKISPPLFRRRVDWFRQNRAFDISKAKRELGYQPKVDLPTGLKRTAEWYQEKQLVKVAA